MIKDLIYRLKKRKDKLTNISSNNEILNEKSNFDINITNENEFLKIEISDCVLLLDFDDKVKSSEEYNVLDLLCNSVLWNSKKQKVNKGTYYVIKVDNRLYNFLFTDEELVIDERINKELDEETGKENIVQESVIRFNINKNKYHYYNAKHESNGNTYYTKYYNKFREYSLGTLDLSEEEAYEKIKNIISNLEEITEINKIINIDLLKKYILDDIIIESKNKKL